MSSSPTSSKRLCSALSVVEPADSGCDVASNLIISGSVTFENLPNEILALILGRFELQQQIHLRRICTKWCASVESFCQSKRILKLFDRLENHPEWDCTRYYKSYYIPHLDSQEQERMLLKGEDLLKVKPDWELNHQPFADFMERLFPAVEVLVYGKEFFTREDVNLIRIWPRNLRELTIVGHQLYHGFTHNLVGVLNSKEGLRRLNLLFYILRTNTNILPLKPTLKRLEGFGFKSHSDIKDILSNLGPNCIHLQMGRVSKERQMINKIYFNVNKLRASMENTNLANTLTHLVLTEFDDEKMLEFLYKELKSLQFVGVECIDKRAVELTLTPTVSFYRLISQMELSSLLNPGLNHAKNIRELKFFQINFELRYGYRDMAPSNVNSVKILRIDFSQDACEHGFSSKDWCKRLAGIFPNLELLVAKHPYDGGEFRDELDKNAKKEFKFLKKVKFVYNAYEVI